MTRKEAKKDLLQKISLDILKISEFIDKIYDDFKNKSCTGCKHIPEDGENFPLQCGSCRRWYGDYYDDGKGE